MSKQIKLIHGIEFSEADKLKAEFKQDGDSLVLTLSAEDYSAFFPKAAGRFQNRCSSLRSFQPKKVGTLPANTKPTILTTAPCL